MALLVLGSKVAEHRLLSGFSKDSVPNWATAVLCGQLWEQFRRMRTYCEAIFVGLLHQVRLGADKFPLQE